jgi:UDP-N-acetyl-D-mannosaminuronate dehydrogenase
MIKSLFSSPDSKMLKCDSVVLAVAHDEFKGLKIEPTDKQVVFDIKSILDKSDGRL